MNGFERMAGNESSAVAVALDRLQLIEERFFLETLRLRAGDRPVQVAELLDVDVLAIFQRDRIVGFLVALQRRFGRLHLLALFPASCAPSQSVASFEDVNFTSRF